MLHAAWGVHQSTRALIESGQLPTCTHAHILPDSFQVSMMGANYGCESEASDGRLGCLGLKLQCFGFLSDPARQEFAVWTWRMKPQGFVERRTVLLGGSALSSVGNAEKLASTVLSWSDESFQAVREAGERGRKGGQGGSKGGRQDGGKEKSREGDGGS